MAAELIEVCMRKETLAGDGRVATPLPAGYALRRYRPGDVATWLRIHHQAEPYHTLSEAEFRREFGADQGPLSERQLYLCAADGEAVGTASAWLPQAHRAPRLGRVHWVAIVPAHQGRGLMVPLVAALLRRFLDLGHDGAYLTTESVRLAAIRGYLRLGFVPELVGAQDAAAWREVERQGVALPAPVVEETATR